MLRARRPFAELLAKDCFNDAGQPMLQASSFDPFNRVGHQGLFFEPLAGAITTPPLSVDRRGLWFNRNRFYDAALGRFLQSDQNATALPVLTALAYNAQTALSMLDGFDAQSHFGDGFNLYSYGRANPVSGADPLGLSWDEDIDDAIADKTGHAFYALGTLNEGARWASLGLQTAVNIAGSLLPGSGLYDAFKSVEVLASGQGGFWDAVNIASAAFPAAKLAGDGFSALRGLFKGRQWGWRACNSFTAGTLVETPEGPLPIEWLQPGDWVLSRHQDDPAGLVVPRRLSGVIIGHAAELVTVTLETGETIQATPEHEFWVVHDGPAAALPSLALGGNVAAAALSQPHPAGDVGPLAAARHIGGRPACELLAGDVLLDLSGRPVRVLDVRLDSADAIVFNLEVSGTFTYYANGVWVHNSSCTVRHAYEMHHLLPRQWKARFRDAGFDIEEFIIPLERSFHKDIHGRGGSIASSWNGAWRRFWDRYPPPMMPTEQEVMFEYGEIFRVYILGQ